METYQELTPNYSRITIDYTQPNGKKVVFEYPNKKGNYGLVAGMFISLFLRIIFFSFVFITPILIIFNFIFGIVFFIDFLLIIVILIGITIFFPFIIALFLYKDKKFLAKTPKLFRKWGIAEDQKYLKVDKLETKEFEIPLFENIFLDYNAEGDFGRYLEKVEIREHNFKYLLNDSMWSKFSFGLIKKQIKQEQNDEIWKAKFYFSEIPKTGFIEVFFY